MCLGRKEKNIVEPEEGLKRGEVRRRGEREGRGGEGSREGGKRALLLFFVGIIRPK